ncbi:hypothetical protein [Tolypothrix sp. VBCCA 56010]|uniref:hypothetical protein n=1 Tax=Tolypothrix sp. VBCCA 56010 TaxID=3137731 RepID=UPI003D7E4EF1
MLTYDPRKISVAVYQNLQKVKDKTSKKEEHDKQKSQAVELYTYVATWGLLRLAGEEPALSNEPQKQAVVKCFFETLEELAFSEVKPSNPEVKPNNLNQPNKPNKPNSLNKPSVGSSKIEKLTKMSASEYLGLTGFALQVAREFSFWAEALYPKQSNGTRNQTNLITNTHL